MNKLNIAATGYPGTTESWKFVKNAYEMIADLVGKMVDPDTPVIISGVKYASMTELTNGYVAYKGEIYTFIGGDITDTVCIYEDKNQANYNTDISDQGQLQLFDTYFERYAKCGDSGDGIDEFLLADTKRIESLLTISELTNQATELNRGTAKIVKIADVTDGTDDLNFLTIKKLVENRLASEDMNGLILVATQADVDNGVIDNKAVTPKKLAETFQIKSKGTEDLGEWADDDYYRSVVVNIPEQPNSDYFVMLTITSDDLLQINNHDNYFAFSRQKQIDNFTITVKRQDDGGSTSGDPHVYVDWVVIKS